MTAVQPTSPTQAVRRATARGYVFASVWALAIVVAACALLWFMSGEAGAARLLSVEPAMASFQARKGDTVTAAFAVKNISSEPVKILGIKPSCGCMIVEHALPIELAPGQATELLLQMKVEEMDPDGRFKQDARLFINRAGVVPSLVIEAVDSAS